VDVLLSLKCFCFNCAVSLENINNGLWFKDGSMASFICILLYQPGYLFEIWELKKVCIKKLNNNNYTYPRSIWYQLNRSKRKLTSDILDNNLFTVSPEIP